MTEIELLTQQIEALQPQLIESSYHITLFLIGFICSLMAAIVIGAGLYNPGFSLPGIAGCIIFLILIFTTDSPIKEELDLIEQRDVLIELETNLMTCDELGINVLNIIEGKEFVPEHLGYNLEKKKELYYYKCEVPLRDEVLKLQ